MPGSHDRTQHGGSLGRQRVQGERLARVQADFKRIVRAGGRRDQSQARGASGQHQAGFDEWSALVKHDSGPGQHSCEQGGKLLPIILPDVINKILGGGFNEVDRNKLMEEAKTQAEKLAQNLARRLRSEVQTSARQTMEMLAKSFGAASVRVEFADAEPRKSDVIQELEPAAT